MIKIRENLELLDSEKKPGLLTFLKAISAYTHKSRLPRTCHRIFLSLHGYTDHLKTLTIAPMHCIFVSTPSIINKIILGCLVALFYDDDDDDDEDYGDDDE